MSRYLPIALIAVTLGGCMTLSRGDVPQGESTEIIEYEVERTEPLITPENDPFAPDRSD